MKLLFITALIFAAGCRDKEPPPAPEEKRELTAGEQVDQAIEYFSKERKK